MKDVPGVFRRHRAFPVLGLIALSSLACTGIASDKMSAGPPGQAGQAGQTGQTAGGGAGSTVAGGGAGGEGVSLLNGGPRLRVLTQTEYTNSVTDLLGAISTPLDLPPDTFTSGFSAIGAGVVTINASAVPMYETASRAAAAEVFANAARWQKFVGCQPKADLSDACVTTFVQTAGKHAFRRDLTDPEVQQWLQVGKDIAQAATSATQGLMAITTGLLQSPYFLYRVETNKLDASSGRLKYDGPSMATRLAYLLTGHTPSDALLAAAAAGQLDTADGVKAAAAPLLTDTSAVARMATFFSEFSGAQLVSVVQKSPDMFPSFNPALQSSMLQATQLFIKNIVLAPGADVRTFFDSNQTFVDATLAPIYGVTAPASGFAQITLGPETGRAGILGQAAVIAGHSQPDHNSPTRRGVFLLETFLCQTPPNPPAGVITTLPTTDTMTTRQKMEQHRASPSCAACHALFDPLGFGLEHFDSIGQYRAMEGTLTIDATGTLDGIAFDGTSQMGAAFRQSSRAMTCMMNSFYRNANGVPDATADSKQIDALTQDLTAKGYVWRDLITDFIASDAFRSAPATAGN
ncbi:MAG TPA: DUF1588 domain-containing protein [Polyangiaceae bacterium]